MNEFINLDMVSKNLGISSRTLSKILQGWQIPITQVGLELVFSKEQFKKKLVQLEQTHRPTYCIGKKRLVKEIQKGVYVTGCPLDPTIIKIGFTTDWSTRKVGVGCPFAVPLHAFYDGFSLEEENKIHRDLKPHRIGGHTKEWYRNNKEVRKYLEEVKKR